MLHIAVKVSLTLKQPQVSMEVNQFSVLFFNYRFLRILNHWKQYRQQQCINGAVIVDKQLESCLT